MDTCGPADRIWANLVQYGGAGNQTLAETNLSEYEANSDFQNESDELEVINLVALDGGGNRISTNFKVFKVSGTNLNE